MNTDSTVMDELFRVYAQPVKSDLELQVKKEIDAWIKKQPSEKIWPTPDHAADEYWAERLK